MPDFWSQVLEDQLQLDSAQSANTENSTKLFPIRHQRIIEIKGPDSAKFMQGQFTCHLDEITFDQYRPGACCNPKGRMISNFNLALIQDQHYLLAIHDSLAEPIINHLKKYQVFFKSQMVISTWIQMGLKGPHANEILSKLVGATPQHDFDQKALDNNRGIVIKLPFNAGYEIWTTPSHAQLLLTELSSDLPLEQDLTWESVLIEHGLPWLTTANTEVHIPQMLNLHLTGALSFTKGCYTGQEIVARMEYLGKLKRHMYKVGFNSTIPATEHANIVPTGSKQAVGHVINCAKGKDHDWQALIVLEHKKLGDLSHLQIESELCPIADLELLSLPYKLESKQ